MRGWKKKLKNRIFPIIIRSKYNDKNVLVVTHSAVLRGMHYLINGIPEDGDMSNIDIPQLRIIEYQI